MKKAFVILVALFPALLCFGLAYSVALDERAFEQGTASAQGTVKAVHDRVRSNGRDSEDITTVEVAFKTAHQRDITAEAVVGYAVGISSGQPIAVLYKVDAPQTIQVRAGFFNRSASFVFLTLFGGFWLVLGMGTLVFLVRVGALAKRPRRD